MLSAVYLTLLDDWDGDFKHLGARELRHFLRHRDVSLLHANGLLTAFEEVRVFFGAEPHSGRRRSSVVLVALCVPRL